jgi:uncharacterized RDD family membrane protein YckC
MEPARRKQVTQVHAELGSRCAGAFLDFLCCFVLLMFIFVAWDDEVGVRAGQAGSALFVALYFAFFTSSRLQATPGKALAAIKVTDLDGNRIGVGRSALRFVAALVSFALAGAGFVIAAWTPRRQALHDLIAGTVVVDANAEPEKIRGQLATPMSVWSRLGTIAMLAMVLLIGHVVADFMRDVKVREAMMAMLDEVEVFRKDVGRAWGEGRPVPRAPASLPSGAKAVVAEADGKVTLETSTGARFVFTPEKDASGTVLWNCAVTGVEQKFLPSMCRY